MTNHDPVTEFEPGFSSDEATATDWSEARELLERAEIFWLSTVRPDGRPHVTPLIAVWVDDSLFFCTGPDERKAMNLAHNSYCALTTGSNALDQGLDLVVEGTAAQATDEGTLKRVSAAFLAKYGEKWSFKDASGELFKGALLFEVKPAKAFGFAKGEFGQTRWRF